MRIFQLTSPRGRAAARLAAIAQLSFTMLLASCGGGGGGYTAPVTPPPATYSLSGRVQKGPFAIGSQMTVNALDSGLNPTGAVFSTQTSDALGDFAVSSKIATPQVEIVAQGFYIDELTGKLSASQIQLRAYSDLSANNSPTVNVVTTLQAQRLKNLVSQGSTFAAANTQSESEVLTLFGIAAASVNALSTADSMRIDGNTDEDAVLLAVSTILAQMATDTAKANGTSESAELSNLVNTIASGIGSTGTLSSAQFIPARNIANTEISAVTVSTNLQTYYAGNGVTFTAPPFIAWVDQSNSGVLPQRLLPVSALVFAAVTAATPGQSTTTNMVTVAGLGAGVVVPVAAPKGVTIIKNGVAVVGQYTIVKDGDTLELQVGALGYDQAVTFTLMVGSSSAQWNVTSSPLGGTLSGLAGTGLVIQDGLGHNVAVPSGSTSFSFAASIALGAAYNVSVLTQPGSPVQICDVSNGSGNAGAAQAGIGVVCAAPAALAYMTSQSGNSITEYLIHATTGAPVSVGTITTSAVPYNIIAGPSGQYVYVANGSAANISVYAVTGSGALASSGTYSSGIDPLSLAINPAGTYLYAADGEQVGPSQNVEAFSIDATTGALTSIGTYAASGVPNAISVDPTGRFVYTSNNNSNSITTFTIDSATGKLTSQGTLACGFPQAVFFEPTGHFAYIPCGSGGLQAFTIDQTNGTLTSSGAYGSPNGFVWVAIDPAGKFAYLSDWGQAAQLPTYAVDTFSIDPMSGALTSMASIPADNSAFFSLDPSGKWGFTRSGASIGVFSVDVSTGTLTALGDYPNGADIFSMAFIDVP